MRIERHGDPAGFFSRVAPFLERREAAHNLLLGFRSTLELDPHAYGTDDPLLLAALDGDAVVGVAVQTPPHNLVLSESDEPRFSEAVVAELSSDRRALPGVLGPARHSRPFAELWATANGLDARIALEQRIYEATGVAAPEGVAGHMRALRPADRQAALRFVAEFFAEVAPDGPAPPPESVVDRRDVVVWDDGGPVSLAAFGSPTRNGIRIGPVYTPPARRGRGYASALTAALTADLLRHRRCCFLSTDLAAPTPNSIYRKIGYRAVTDVTVWAFAPA